MSPSKLSYRYGGKRGKSRRLRVDDSLIVVRTNSRRPISRSPLGKPSRAALSEFETIVQFADAGVEVLRVSKRSGQKAVRDRARRTLKKDPDIQFAGRVLTERGSDLPVIYTENLFIKFVDDVRMTAAKKVLRSFKLKVKQELPYARAAFFVEATPGSGQEVFAIAEQLLDDEIVEFAHPELIRPQGRRAAAPQQWHLHKTRVGSRTIDQHANVVAAWEMSEGAETTIAIIDDGVDVDHPDFAGAGRVVHPRDVTRGVNDARPFNFNDNHGTSCAGVACASGLHGASGVAPRARLMPIRMASALGSQAEADAFYWAAQHGADVISCSWGPVDGQWWNPNDPQHNAVVALPDSTRLAINWAVENGRNGKGCVITWAAGNGNEPVDNDGYASYSRVAAIAACSDRGKRSVYSDKGDAIWCAFPSNDFTSPELTPGIWTTDRSGGAGYNSGSSTATGDLAGNYAADFGGTSSACPGAAGVAALVLARNPTLRWDEVKDILKRSAKKIGTGYDAEGHSPEFGYGRLDAAKAVALAQPPQPKLVTLHQAQQDVKIEDNKTSRLRVAVGDTATIREVRIHVDIEHTYIGDLVVKVKAPNGATATLHNRAGGSTSNLRATYDSVNAPQLAAMVQTSPTGRWTLEVRDTATQDTGKIVRFGVELSL